MHPSTEHVPEVVIFSEAFRFQRKTFYSNNIWNFKATKTSCPPTALLLPSSCVQCIYQNYCTLLYVIYHQKKYRHKKVQGEIVLREGAGHIAIIKSGEQTGKEGTRTVDLH